MHEALKPPLQTAAFLVRPRPQGSTDQRCSLLFRVVSYVAVVSSTACQWAVDEAWCKFFDAGRAAEPPEGKPCR